MADDNPYKGFVIIRPSSSVRKRSESRQANKFMTSSRYLEVS